MSSSRRRFLQTAGAGAMAARAEGGVPTISPLQSAVASGRGWQVAFGAASSTLKCGHAGTGTTLAGHLSFSGTGASAATKWSILPARDSHAQRLALLDQERNEVQGYINLVVDGNRIFLSLSPRPPRFVTGELTFTPEARFGANAFACRTAMPQHSMVVQMASGPADSLLNDSLFNPQRDVVLRFSGERISITTHPEENAAPKFQMQLKAVLGDDCISTLALELMPNYYRERYVPDYRLIDRKRCPSAPTGWMSWNAYFDAATEQDNLEDARIAARTLKPFGLETWEIESWQENSSELPVRNFHSLSLRHSPEKFPHGMKWLAEQIRPLGFKPGIWTVPWGTGDDKFYQEHRAWFLHDSKGQPFQNWNGRYILDPSQPEVRRHMEETHRIMSAEWGYEMFKVDGMSFSVRMFERPDVRAAFRQPCTEPFQLSLEALRRGMGPDRIVLACNGHYPGPEVPFFDAARIGGDLVSPGKPPNWNSYLSQARVTLAQLFVHNLIWYNDPDTLMVGEVTPLSMARVATTIVALPGQLTFISDKLRQLPAQRMRLLQQALPVCDVRPLDLMPISDLKPVWDLKIRRRFASWDVVSIFNWGDEAQDYRIAFETLGLDAKKAYLLYEFWSGMFHGVRRGFINTHVEPQSNLLLAVHELKDHPQFLSTDRHISQGGVELIDVAWKAERGELVSRVKLVENDILTMSVHVPADYAYREAIATGATVEDVGGIGAVKTVLLRRATSGEAELTLSFTRQSQVGQ